MQRCSFSGAPKRGVMHATFFDLTSTKFQTLYHNCLFSVVVMTEERDFRGVSCSLIVREKTQVHLDLHMKVKVLKTSRIGANLSQIQHHFLFCWANVKL